jgi:hypothetical protein
VSTTGIFEFRIEFFFTDEGLLARAGAFFFAGAWFRFAALEARAFFFFAGPVERAAVDFFLEVAMIFAAPWRPGADGERVIKDDSPNAQAKI